MRTLIRFCAELLFPRFCIGCGYLGAYLCPGCQRGLQYNLSDVCCYCGKAAPWGLTHALCRRKNGVEGLMTILHYNSLLKKIIKSIKYRLAKEVAQELFAVFNGKMLGKLSFYKRIGAPLWAVCIPLHKAKLKQRGFNQAELVEEFVRTYIPLEPLTALERRHERHAQAMLARGLAKHQNVRGVFAVVSPEKVRGKTIVLIDDIVTTGATVREAARVLKLAGAAKVFIIALAKG